MLPLSVPTHYRPDRSRAPVTEDIHRSIDMHVSRAREEARLLSKPLQLPVDQGALRSMEFRSLGAETSFPHMAQQSAEHSSGSLNQMLSYSQSTASNSDFYLPTAASTQSGTRNLRFSSGGERDGQSKYDYSVADLSKAAAPPSRPKYTSESAANILMHFGLEKEDLEHLISYPEDQITPANLPFILRQIRTEKARKEYQPRASPTDRPRASIAEQPKQFAESLPSRGVAQSDSWTPQVSSRQDDEPPPRPQTSKVIDYGHTGKYTGGMSNKMDSNGHTQELQKAGRSTLASSSHDSAYASILNKTAPPAKQPQTLTAQTPAQKMFASFALPKKDTSVTVCEASKPAPFKEKDPECLPLFKPPTSLFRDVHPSRPGLVVLGSSAGTRDRSESQGQSAKAVTEQPKKLPPPTSSQKQQQVKVKAQKLELKKKQQQQEQPQKQQLMPHQKPPLRQGPMAQTLWPAAFGGLNVPASPLPPFQLPSLLDLTRPPMYAPPPQPVTLSPLSRPPPAVKVDSYRGLPMAAMMQDYAAASPRVFPHTCSLCNKECTVMKVSGRLLCSVTVEIMGFIF